MNSRGRNDGNVNDEKLEMSLKAAFSGVFVLFLSIRVFGPVGDHRDVLWCDVTSLHITSMITQFTNPTITSIYPTYLTFRPSTQFQYMHAYDSALKQS